MRSRTFVYVHEAQLTTKLPDATVTPASVTLRTAVPLRFGTVSVSVAVPVELAVAEPLTEEPAIDSVILSLEPGSADETVTLRTF